MNRILLSLSIVCLVATIGCGNRTGTITVVNPTLDSVVVEVDGKTISVAPGKHFTQKGVKKGPHQIKIGSKPAISINVDKKRTTLVDIAGDNCFVVADYTDQYGEKGTGSVKILEKFVNKTSLVTENNVTSELGEHLPETIHGHRKITRIHRVDCGWIDNDQAIIDAISNLP